MDYLRQRYFASDLGRFVSEDPFDGIISLPISLNRYQYAGNDPINASDPSGEVTLTETLVVSGIGSVVGGGLLSTIGGSASELVFRSAGVNLILRGAESLASSSLFPVRVISSGFDLIGRSLDRLTSSFFRLTSTSVSGFSTIINRSIDLAADGGEVLFSSLATGFEAASTVAERLITTAGRIAARPLNLLATGFDRIASLFRDSR